jgi:hypothetical protein
VTVNTRNARVRRDVIGRVLRRHCMTGSAAECWGVCIFPPISATHQQRYGQYSQYGIGQDQHPA